MSTATKVILATNAVILLLLACNYEFAERLYLEEVQSGEVISFSFRGSCAAGLFDFPEDRIGGVLSILFAGCLVAFALQYKNDLAGRNVKADRQRKRV